jgi:hypothetical protein
LKKKQTPFFKVNPSHLLVADFCNCMVAYN